MIPYTPSVDPIYPFRDSPEGVYGSHFECYWRYIPWEKLTSPEAEGYDYGQTIVTMVVTHCGYV